MQSLLLLEVLLNVIEPFVLESLLSKSLLLLDLGSGPSSKVHVSITIALHLIHITLGPVRIHEFVDDARREESKLDWIRLVDPTCWIVGNVSDTILLG